MKIQHTLDTAAFVDGMKRMVQTKKEADVLGVHGMTVSGSVEYDTGSYDPDGAIVSYAWTQTATKEHNVHRFQGTTQFFV